MSTKRKVKGLGVLHQGSVESVYGAQVLQLMAGAKFGNTPDSAKRAAAWMPKGAALLDLQYEIGCAWDRARYTPVEVSGAVLAVDNVLFVKPEWAAGDTSVKRAKAALDRGRINAAAMMNVSIEAVEHMSEIEATVEVTSALQMAQAVIRARGVDLNDLNGVRDVMRSRIGNLCAYIRCALSGMDPEVLFKFGADAKEELVANPALQCALRRVGVDTTTILNHANR